MAGDTIIRGTADFSPCGRFRWTLTRTWGDGPIALVCGANPSDDDTDLIRAFPEAFEVSQVWEAVDMARGWWGKRHPEMAAYLRSPDAAAVVALTDEYGAKCIREGRFRRGGAWSIHRDPEALPGARWGCSWSPIRPGEHRLVSIHADYPVVGPHPTREEIAAVAMQVTRDED